MARNIPGEGGPPWIGVNYWARPWGMHMWRHYDGSAVREELRSLAAQGCTLTRSFLLWSDFMPRPELLDEKMSDHLSDFLSAHSEVGLVTLPSFLIGHMSGANWDPDWIHGRDLYRDVWSVAQQAWFAAELGRRFGQHPAIAGWVLTNEMPRYASPASPKEVKAWASLLVYALRAAGARQPVSLGDGAWGIEVTGNQNGYSLAALDGLIDFVGVHSYPTDSDALRQMLIPAFNCELAGYSHKPVILEEFGASSDLADDARIADYYRHVLYSTLIAGGRGWLAWCNADYDRVCDEEPYRTRTYETHFGVTDQFGQAKAQLQELGTFSQWLAALTSAGWRRWPAEVAIVVPSAFQHSMPFDDEFERQDIRAALLQCYVAAREADIAVRMVPEHELADTPYRLYLAPCSRVLSASGWRLLRAAAVRGGTIYLSHFAGGTARRHGAWNPVLREMCGVRHRMAVGLTNPCTLPEVELRFLTAFGTQTAGSVLRFATAGTIFGRDSLRIEATEADVVAVDNTGEPALICHPLGAGHVILCTYPLEYFAAEQPQVNPENCWRLYSALATFAGVPRLVSAQDPRVLVALIDTDGPCNLVIANTADERVETRIQCEPGVSIALGNAKHTQDTVPTTVTLSPFEVIQARATGLRSDRRVV